MRSSNGHILLSATDLSNHLACHHLTQLDRQVAVGKIAAPKWFDPAVAILVQRGQEHEDGYVDFLKRRGLSIKDLEGQNREATLEAMRHGYDVITQASLGNDMWTGRADILRRVETPSNLGKWSYEVEDTKLAQDTRTSTILQLCLYTDFVASLQGCLPAMMHVVKPGEGFPKESFLVTDFQAYFRFTRKRLSKIIEQFAKQARDQARVEGANDYAFIEGLQCPGIITP